jgi:hypothetical protein
MFSECVYIESGLVLPCVEMRVYSSSDRPAEKLEDIHGIEYDTIALQEKEIEEIEARLRASRVALASLRSSEGQVRQANEGARVLLSYCTERRRRLESGSVIAYALLRWKGRRLHSKAPS